MTDPKARESFHVERFAFILIAVLALEFAALPFTFHLPPKSHNAIFSLTFLVGYLLGELCWRLKKRFTDPK
jgi:hypothetical protein